MCVVVWQRQQGNSAGFAVCGVFLGLNILNLVGKGAAWLDKASAAVEVGKWICCVARVTQSSCRLPADMVYWSRSHF